MGMAKAAAQLIREHVRLGNGQPVEVILADSTIGGVNEAMACADKFEKEGVHITLTVTPCWCYGTETLDMNPHTLKRYGALTEQSARARFIWRAPWPVMRKKAFLVSAFTATMCKRKTNSKFRPMSQKRFCVSPERR